MNSGTQHKLLLCEKLHNLHILLSFISPVWMLEITSHTFCTSYNCMCCTFGWVDVESIFNYCMMFYFVCLFIYFSCSWACLNKKSFMNFYFILCDYARKKKKKKFFKLFYVLMKWGRHFVDNLFWQILVCRVILV